MDRNEFVSTLRAVLTGEVPGAVVEDNVRYYDSYISQEIAGGKSEREVLESLGDPRLIAKTIIDTYQGPTEEAQMEFDQETGRSPEYHQVNRNTWYGRLLTFVIIGLILIVVFTFLSWILPILLPILLVVWIVRILFQRR